MARKALRAGWRVRRSGWNNRWLQRWHGGLYWLIFADGTRRVVRFTDFTREDFLALDWTNLPPDCITGGVSQGEGSACPLPFDPNPPAPGGITPGTTPPGGGGITPGTTPPGGGGTDPGIGTDPGAAPGGGAGGQIPGGGGGGGGGRRPVPKPPGGSWPTITVTAQDDTGLECYEQAGTSSSLETAVYSGSIALSAGTSRIFFCSVRNGSKVIWTGTLIPGESSGWGPVSLTGVPGQSQFTFEGRAWLSGSPNLTGSTSSGMASWCDDDNPSGLP